MKELFSSRAHALVTDVKRKAMLTVGNTPNGISYSVELGDGFTLGLSLGKYLECLEDKALVVLVNDLLCDEEINGCITPRGFVTLAEILSLKFDYRTYLAVLNMYNEKVYDYVYCLAEDGSSEIVTFDEYLGFVSMVSGYCCSEETVKKNCTDWNCFCSS